MPASSTITSLRITYFRAEKLRNYSDGQSALQRQSSPYQITTFRGPELGLIGSLPAVLHKFYEIDSADAANREDSPVAQNTLLERFKRYCLQR